MTPTTSADEGFPVQNVEIVGTELRSVERVTGRMTRGRIAAAGALSGLWTGLFVGITFSLCISHNQLGVLLTTPLLGGLFGLAWSQFGYSTATRDGTRDFASVGQVATKYEVRAEYQLAERARQLLGQDAAEGHDLTPGKSTPCAPQPAIRVPVHDQQPLVGDDSDDR